MGNAVHRLIEQQAASRPDTAAIVDGTGAISYRELNQRANTLARRLRESGLTRGAIAGVRMERGVDLAIVLLAVLKAGAAYEWIEPGSPYDVELPAPFCILGRRSADEDQYTAVDISAALENSAARPSPNLPVLTRASDIACVLPDAGGRPHVLVPHATIVALPQMVSGRNGSGDSAPGAFDLWLRLMTGATMTLGATPSASAAA